eukprot:1571866-Prymnesium_polylepis.1
MQIAVTLRAAESRTKSPHGDRPARAVGLAVPVGPTTTWHARGGIGELRERTRPPLASPHTQ